MSEQRYYVPGDRSTLDLPLAPLRWYIFDSQKRWWVTWITAAALIPINIFWLHSGYVSGLALGINVALIVERAWTATLLTRKVRNGHRKASEDDHRGTDRDPDAAPGGMSAIAEAGASEDVDDAALAIEPVIGLRAWNVRGGFLYSATQQFHWPPRVAASALCGIDRHLKMSPVCQPPGKSCSCGLYAAKRELEIQYNAGEGPFVWGRVALWGRVEEAERGYRGQHGYPVSLTLVNAPHHPQMRPNGTMSNGGPPYTDEALEDLRSNLALHYGIPVRIGTLDELTRARAENYEAMGLPAEVKDLVG